MYGFVALLIRILEIMFVVGTCGSVLVWLLTGIELLSVLRPDETTAVGESDSSDQSAT